MNLLPNIRFQDGFMLDSPQNPYHSHSSAVRKQGSLLPAWRKHVPGQSLAPVCRHPAVSLQETRAVSDSTTLKLQRKLSYIQGKSPGYK